MADSLLQRLAVVAMVMQFTTLSALHFMCMAVRHWQQRLCSVAVFTAMTCALPTMTALEHHA
jgi:hypothetical protein